MDNRKETCYCVEFPLIKPCCNHSVNCGINCTVNLAQFAHNNLEKSINSSYSYKLGREEEYRWQIMLTIFKSESKDYLSKIHGWKALKKWAMQQKPCPPNG